MTTYDTPGKRLAKLERELRQERDEYAKLWQMYGGLEDERDRQREAIETHRRNVWGEDSIEHSEDRELCAALQEAGDE